MKEIITGTSLDPHYNVWIEFLLDDRQLVFMFYVVLARIILGLAILPFVLIANRLAPAMVNQLLAGRRYGRPAGVPALAARASSATGEHADGHGALFRREAAAAAAA